MLNRIFIGVLVILFVLLGYFGFRQMQLANQLQDDLNSKTQQLDALKQSVADLILQKTAQDKKLQDCNTALQNNTKDLEALKTSLATQTTENTKLSAETKLLQSKVSALQTANQKIEAEKKSLQSQSYAQTQALEAKVKMLSTQLQQSQTGTTAVTTPPTSMSAATTAPSKSGIGAKLN